MILIILFALLLIAGIICVRMFWDRFDYADGLPIISLIATFVGGLGLVCCVIIVLLNNTYVAHTQAEDSYAKYTAIQQYNSEVREFKEEIIQTQAYLGNPWINWMCNYEYKNFDANIVSYINIE